MTVTKASKAAAWSQTTDCCVAAAGVLTASLLISVRCEGGVKREGEWAQVSLTSSDYTGETVSRSHCTAGGVTFPVFCFLQVKSEEIRAPLPPPPPPLSSTKED